MINHRTGTDSQIGEEFSGTERLEGLPFFSSLLKEFLIMCPLLPGVLTGDLPSLPPRLLHLKIPKDSNYASADFIGR